jgi:hypothetical protein
MRSLSCALVAVAALVLASPALAQQALLQAGPWDGSHVPMYVGPGGNFGQPILQDSGPAAGGAAGVGLSELGLTVQGTGTPPYANAGTGPFGANVCDYDAPKTNATGYHYICLSPNAQGGESIIAGAGGAAAQLPLQFIANGVVTPIGGLISSVANSDGTLTISPTTGVVIASLALGHANTWSGVQTFGANDLVLGGVTGSTQCLHASSFGVVTGTGSDCGGGGTVTSVAITAGANVTTSGTCSGSTIINCTVNAAGAGGSVVTTVAGLATAFPSPGEGQQAYVTDAVSCVFGAGLTGGASSVPGCPVQYAGGSFGWVAY